VDATAVGGALTRTELAAGASSSQAQMGVVTTSPNDDEFDVLMGHPASRH
jgi:hypothetical protein